MANWHNLTERGKRNLFREWIDVFIMVSMLEGKGRMDGIAEAVKTFGNAYPEWREDIRRDPDETDGEDG